MLKLGQLQERFSAALLDPAAETPEQWVRTNGIDARRRLAVYRNNSRISQTDALSGIYPAIQRLVGEEFFEQLAEDYGRVFPSTSGDLRAYGASLAKFLERFEPVSGISYLPDVARLEWAWHECFHAADENALQPCELAPLATNFPDHLRLSLIPAARLLASSYPVAHIWTFALDAERQRDGLDIEQLNEARLLIARRNEHVEVMELTLPQFALLENIAKRNTLASAFEETLTQYPQVDLPSEFATFVELRVLMKTHIGAE